MAGAGSGQPRLKLHLIGPLQSNKAKEAVALFDAIHSVDRASICEALAKEIRSQQQAAGPVRPDRIPARSRRRPASRPAGCRRLHRERVVIPTAS